MQRQYVEIEAFIFQKIHQVCNKNGGERVSTIFKYIFFVRGVCRAIVFVGNEVFWCEEMEWSQSLNCLSMLCGDSLKRNTDRGSY